MRSSELTGGLGCDRPPVRQVAGLPLLRDPNGAHMPVSAHRERRYSRRVYGCWLKDLRSNSPPRTPPMKASHSAGVKFKTAPLGCLLSRTRIVSRVRPATSTQFPLYPLRELFIHVPLESLAECRLLKRVKSRIKFRLCCPMIFGQDSGEGREHRQVSA